MIVSRPMCGNPSHNAPSGFHHVALLGALFCLVLQATRYFAPSFIYSSRPPLICSVVLSVRSFMVPSVCPSFLPPFLSPFLSSTNHFTSPWRTPISQRISSHHNTTHHMRARTHCADVHIYTCTTVDTPLPTCVHTRTRHHTFVATGVHTCACARMHTSEVRLHHNES